MIQAVDLIDCDHGDDLNEQMDACERKEHWRPTGDPHMDDSIKS